MISIAIDSPAIQTPRNQPHRAASTTQQQIRPRSAVGGSRSLNTTLRLGLVRFPTSLSSMSMDRSELIHSKNSKSNMEHCRTRAAQSRAAAVISGIAPMAQSPAA
jgi:hypothetical protein